VTDFAGQLRHAFPVEPVPAVLFDKRYPCDSDQNDAALLQGLAWTEVAPEFWRDHWWALTSLRPEAFVYYLPSLLEVSLTEELPYDMARDSLIQTLDTSADIETTPHFSWNRFLLLSHAQFECLEAWIEVLGSKGWFHDALQRERVELTVMVLQEEAEGRANPLAQP
jgi:hypothetical protein